MAQEEIRSLAKPLTRRTKSGMQYARPPEVEAQLESLLHSTVDEQLVGTKLQDRESPQFVKDECLVYLIHEAGLADDDARFSALTRQLLGRCTPSITGSLRNLGVPASDVEDALSEVVSAMISAIISDDGKGDFYQARFGKALRCQILKVHARYLRRQKRRRREVAFSGAPKGGVENEDAIPLEERVAAPGDIAGDFENRLLIRAALAAIKDPRHREAFVLQNYDGWQVESIDPLEPTISGHFGKTPRTIRTWISMAERDVAEWRVAQLRDEELPT